DLVVRMALHVPKQDRRPVLRPQGADRGLDLPAQLAAGRVGLRVLARRHRRERARLRLGCVPRVRRTVQRQHLRLLLAEPVQRRVVRDLEDPRTELVRRVVAVERVQDLDERVLREVLGLLAVADQPVDEGEHGPLVTSDQLAIRRVTALTGTGDDLLVGEILVVHVSGRRDHVFRLRPLRSGSGPGFIRARGALMSGSHAGSLGTPVYDAGASRAMSTGQMPASAPPRERAAAVRGMFGAIAPRYDLLNHLLSLNIDRLWRRRTVARLLAGQPPDGVYLDACAGTLDLSLALARRPAFGGRIVAADFSLPMLERGAAKLRGQPISPVCGDALRLPFPDGAF